MPRKARKESGTGIFHVMMRGINHQKIIAMTWGQTPCHPLGMPIGAMPMFNENDHHNANLKKKAEMVLKRISKSGNYGHNNDLSYRVNGSSRFFLRMEETFDARQGDVLHPLLVDGVTCSNHGPGDLRILQATFEVLIKGNTIKDELVSLYLQTKSIS